MMYRNERRASVGDIYIDSCHNGMHGSALIVVTDVEDKDRFGHDNQLARVRRYTMNAGGESADYLEDTKTWILSGCVGTYLGQANCILETKTLTMQNINTESVKSLTLD